LIGSPRRLTVSISSSLRECWRVEPAGEIAQQPIGFVGIVELPGLSERPAHCCVQRIPPVKTAA
jgi:hypothetical protein